MTKFEFNTLVTQQEETLRMHALQFTKDPEDANDLLQDTFVKAVLYYGQFKEGTNINGWLYIIMRNTFINNYRRTKKSNALIIKTDEISNSNLIYSATKNEAEGKFIMNDIHNALNKLADEYYIPFQMYFEGYKYHEIAEELTIPIGTVKTRIHMARKFMKTALKTYKGN